jgi:arylsulfatase A-like enzyme/Flp pilus assembly protein TadD
VTRFSRRATPALGLVLLLAVAWSLFRFNHPRAPTTVSPRLNLLLITLDTTRADHLGCYGSTAAKTPNLDRLARDGTLFAQCSSCSPLTLPSHASIMTAVSPYVHGARRNGSGEVPAANLTLAETLSAAGYRTLAVLASFVLDRQFGLAQGFEFYHDLPLGTADNPMPLERRADFVADDAIGLLRSHSTERFFLWVHFYDPHFPYQSVSHADPASPDAYADEIAFMDQHVGRLLAELLRLNLDSSTLVVVVGDHGESLGERSEPTHGYFLYQTTLHVPLILRCPGTIRPGQSVSTPVRTIDIAPTILELLRCPEMPDVEGTSLCLLLQGQDLPLPLPAYAETFEAHSHFRFSPLRSLTLRGLKYILSPKPELYDLPADPGETRDVASDRPEDAARLRKELRDLVVHAPRPPHRSTAVGLPSTDIARLESLGYVGADARGDAQAELDLLEPRGGNPCDHADLLQLHFQGREALKQGRFPAAEEIFLRLIDAVPAAPQLHASLARALRGQRRLDEAVQAAQAALALAPDDIYIRGVYGSLLSDAQRWEEAAEQFRLVLDKTPRDTVILHSMGTALVFLGHLDEADRCFQVALSVEPENAPLLHSLGVLRSRQGRSEEAVACLRRALAIDPSLSHAAEDLQLIERNMNH